MTCLSMAMTWTFVLFSHPLTLTMIIIVQALASCFMMGMILKNFWLPYMLLIIMLGGLMIMFMYMCSTTPNQMMTMSPMLLIVFIIASPMFTETYKNSLVMLNHANSTNNMNFFNLLMNIPNHLMFPLMMVTLMITMFSVTKISYSSESPLRTTLT